MNKIVALATYVGIMVLGMTGNGGAMTCPDTCDTIGMTIPSGDSILGRNDLSRIFEVFYGVVKTERMDINGFGTEPDRDQVPGGNIYCDILVGIRSSWTLDNMIFGFGNYFARWSGNNPLEIDIATKCDENVWSNYLHFQTSESNLNHSNGHPMLDNLMVVGSAIIFFLGSGLTGIFCWGKKRKSVLRSKHRRGLRHRYEL